MVFNPTFQQYFSYIMAVSFIGGWNRSTRRKPLTCRKSQKNFIIYLVFGLHCELNFLFLVLGSFLAHLTQRVMWGIAITWRPSSVRRPSSVVRRPSSVVRRPSVNFSYFNLLLWNNWTKWNQIWQKASI